MKITNPFHDPNEVSFPKFICAVFVVILSVSAAVMTTIYMLTAYPVVGALMVGLVLILMTLKGFTTLFDGPEKK